MSQPTLPRRALLAALLAAACRPARAASGRAAIPDVAVFCDRALAPALRYAVSRFAAPVHLFSTAPAGMLAQIERQTQTDVLITGRATMADGVARKLVLPETRRQLGRVALVIAGRDPAPPVPAETGPILRRLGDGRFAAPDPTAASTVDAPAILARLGLTAPLTGRLDGTLDTDGAAWLVAGGADRLGLVYLTDVRADPRLSVAAALPDAAAYDVAAACTAASPNTASFIAFLTTGPGAALLREAGMEVT